MIQRYEEGTFPAINQWRFLHQTGSAVRLQSQQNSMIINLSTGRVKTLSAATDFVDSRSWQLAAVLSPLL